jgi:hypothetical protein
MEMGKRQFNRPILACVFLLSTIVVAENGKRTFTKESSTNLSALKLGSYNAEATQTMEYLDVKDTSEVEIKIKIDSVDTDGNVKGEFIHSTLGNGGKGGLIGKISDSNSLLLKGSLISKFRDKWQVTLTATIGDKALTKGQYLLKARTTTMTGRFDTAELEENN